MQKTFPEYKKLDLSALSTDILEYWKKNKVFEKSIEKNQGKESFVFFEGPPSANGLPGIHHVMARAIKDIFCRYQTLQGKQVKRKAGWDTHGLPVELGVEKELGITKEDIGKKITIAQYNEACKKAVMRYTDIWNNLTEKMGYWVDMNNPYVTYEPKYMESVWWLLAQLYKKNLIYKGYTIQPYSPKAGTGLSSHELNQPGCYKDVKDTTVVAMFLAEQLTAFDPAFTTNKQVFFLAWTTTPWTLPSNTALTIGPEIEYALVESYNQYSKEHNTFILAKNLISKVFGKPFEEVKSEEEIHNYSKEAKAIPYRVVEFCKGKDLVGSTYQQLLPYTLPCSSPEQAFRVISGDFVTTEDGTGIVHTAPTFGADDAKAAQEAGVPPMLIRDENNNEIPLVDLQGRFISKVSDPLFGLGGEHVKAEYLSEEEKAMELQKQQENLKSIIPELKGYLSVDERIALKLKLEGKAFKIEKYEHNYPHCWRTDKPILYYPLDSWFIRVTDQKDSLVALNNTIQWKPQSTGSGRFGKWLENANDWNLSRSRYWGIPIPIWSTEEGEERICIESVEQLKTECEKSVQAGLMTNNPFHEFNAGDMSKENYNRVDLHKHIVDQIILVSTSGKPMRREADLIDVWFDSGAMPYAQWHYPFENTEMVDNHKGYPADFIAEGVDQTRGWFYTLHTISTLIFDKVAYKNVVSNGLVLDKNGQKMSKRLGNAIDPFETLSQYGPDATRWYMITNAQPWDNLKFDLEGIVEVQRKFFGTLYNTYSFFSLYANIDKFDFNSPEIQIELRPEIDRWIISKLNSLIKSVQQAYEDYEPTKAGRALQDFVTEELSNWYVRLCRRRFWKNDNPSDKTAAYQTLYQCLKTVSILASPIAPFFMDRMFMDLTQREDEWSSVHLTQFPKVTENHIDSNLEKRMSMAQNIVSVSLGLRKKEQIKVRQPLQQIMIPALEKDMEENLLQIKELILSELNIKELQILKDTEKLVKNIKPNFKTIGPKYGKQMKAISTLIQGFGAKEIAEIEANKGWCGSIDGTQIELNLDDFEISTQDIPGWLVASENGITVALDMTISQELKNEGIAREVINRIQNFRKENEFEVTDKIDIQYNASIEIQQAISLFNDYICQEVLADRIVFNLNSPGMSKMELNNEDFYLDIKVIYKEQKHD